MRKMWVWVSLTVFTWCAYANSETKLVDLATAKQALIRYHDSGAYFKEIDEAVTDAMAYLQVRLANSKAGKKLAVILDIDETALSNYPNMVKMSFGGDMQAICQAETQGVDERPSCCCIFYYSAL
jgi:predicted secreted acid phosphatase